MSSNEAALSSQEDLNDYSINSKDIFKQKYNSCTELKSLVPLSPHLSSGYSFQKESRRPSSTTRRTKSQYDLLKKTLKEGYTTTKVVSDGFNNGKDSEEEGENVIRIYFKTPPPKKRALKKDTPIVVTHVNSLDEPSTQEKCLGARYTPLDSWSFSISQTVKCTYMENDQNKIMNGISRLFVNKDEIVYRAGVYNFREETPPYKPKQLKERALSTLYF
uniref:Uncharacterized protein n=1 Tax=Lepeophtheirus salmonis TaxID=72036 RepID=A0A0K2T0B4_LEPSM